MKWIDVTVRTHEWTGRIHTSFLFVALVAYLLILYRSLVLFAFHNESWRFCTPVIQWPRLALIHAHDCTYNGGTSNPEGHGKIARYQNRTSMQHWKCDLLPVCFDSRSVWWVYSVRTLATIWDSSPWEIPWCQRNCTVNINFNWGRDKMVAYCRRNFQMNFLECKYFCPN